MRREPATGLKFYVARDAGTIIEYTYTGVTLPSHFLQFDGRLISSGVAELTWDAVTDQMHDYFEVERSADGNIFISLGRSVVFPPYKFIDPSVQPGNNYYRIKQVDKDGKIIYSREIKIVYDPSRAVITTYPNPVSNYLNIRISSAKKARISMTLTDIEGKIIYRQSDIFEPGIKDVKIDMQTMQAEVYIMRITDDNGEILATEKILKLN